MNYFLALSGLFALGVASGCTNAASPQTAQAPPPSVSTPAPVAVVKSGPLKSPTAPPVAVSVSGAPTPSASTVAAALDMPGAPSNEPAGTNGSGAPAPLTQNTPVSISQEVASISGQIRAASTEEEASKHAFASQSVADELAAKMASDPTNASIYGMWQGTMAHLASAAQFKAKSFHAWNDVDAKSKILNMEVDLNAAKSAAQQTDREIENRQSPALKAARQRAFEDRVRLYERQGR